MSERTTEEFKTIIDVLREKGIEDDVWSFKAEVFEMMRTLGYYPEDTEGPDHEEELRAVMIKLVEAH
jgi:hypothetical protein